MSDIPGAWFHCCHCGALFKASADSASRGNCPSCGRDPSSDEEGEAGVEAPARVRRKVRKPSSGKHKKRRSREGRRKARALMIFVIVWGVLVAVTALVMKAWSPEAPKTAPGYVEKTYTPSEEDVRLLKDNFADCQNCLRQLLDSSDSGARSQWVLKPEKTVLRMARYYNTNSATPASTALVMKLSGVLHTPGGTAIEGLWTQEDGQQVEAVLFKEGDDWKIDWDAFTRYNSEPWALFLAAQGHGDGVFRVLARERIGASGRDEEFISLVLYVPRPGHLGEATSASPEIKIKRATPLGLRIQEALDARRRGQGAFGSKLAAFDPEEMIRLRVRLSREGEAERVFKIEELLATHWLELDEPPVKAE